MKMKFISSCFRGYLSLAAPFFSFTQGLESAGMFRLSEIVLAKVRLCSEIALCT